MQFSRTKKFHLGRTPRTLLLSALVLWTVLAFVFGVLAADSLERDVLAGIVYWGAAAFAVFALGYAVSRTEGK